MRYLKNVVLFVLVLCSSIIASAQINQAPEHTITWSVSTKALKGQEYELIFTGNILKSWHTYGLKNEYSATELKFENSNAYKLVGKTYEISKAVEHQGEKVFFNQIVLGQKVKLISSAAKISGNIGWRACNDGTCASPEDWDFEVEIPASGAVSSGAANSGVENASEKSGAASSGARNGSDNSGVANSGSAANSASVGSEVNTSSTANSSNVASNANKATISQSSKSTNGPKTTSIWSLIIEAVLWGFAMILTPCVFPMVPMTVSYFLKGSKTAAEGRFKAIMYGVFIVLLYTLPISIIIALTRILGGDTVTADIFNWLATHWIPNIIFFIVFMVFAASFFGAFEISLPSSLANKSDKNADKKGLIGIFFMALTLVLVSFSCTGPIVGTVLIKSTQGEFWAPMVTMLAFSLAFALPFTIFALFPSLLNKLKNGSWMNSVKVVLGFIEVALAFKFLSIPDQTYHWDILDREVYLAIWIVVFSLLGLYLLGKIRFAHDEKVEKIGIVRLALVITVFSFVVYMIPGMFGAPLKGISGYLPPLETQDFVIRNNTVIENSAYTTDPMEQKYKLKLPLELQGYFTLDEGIAAAKKFNKPIFVDITGHGCTNCREMESRVWSAPKVLSRLQNDFIIVALYTDDKTELQKEDWITTDKGKVIKDMGRANSYIVRSKFGVNAQPNYAILSPEGKLLVPIRGYNLNVNEFADFLDSGIKAFKAGQN